MPKVIPVADELSKPFWDAVNAKRLVLQHCGACNKLQYPPQKTCQVCGSDAKLTWKEVSGKGHIATYIVIEDGRLNRRMADSRTTWRWSPSTRIRPSTSTPTFPAPRPTRCRWALPSRSRSRKWRRAS